MFKRKVENKNNFSKKYVFPIFSFLIIFSLLFPYETKSNDKKGNTFLNILLITMDTTRADRVGCYGYEKAQTPNIDSLASKGIRFSNVYSPVPLTFPSHCSILTGTYPLYHQVHNNGYYYLDPENLTLAEMLKQRDFKTAAFISSFTLDSRFFMDQGFELYDDKFRENELLKSFRSERKADEVFIPFSQWIDQNYKNKFFAWVHFFDPHLPYNPPPSYREKFSHSPYDGEIAFMDHYIGEIIDQLKKKNILDRTLVILVGDHGEGLGEKREIDHGLFLYNSNLSSSDVLFPDFLVEETGVKSGRNSLKTLNRVQTFTFQHFLVRYIYSFGNKD